MSGRLSRLSINMPVEWINQYVLISTSVGHCSLRSYRMKPAGRSSTEPAPLLACGTRGRRQIGWNLSLLSFLNRYAL